MREKLLPCPFCGSDAHFVKCAEPDTARVMCVNAGKCTASRDQDDPYGYATKEIAAEVWNHRPPLPPCEGLVEKLEAIGNRDEDEFDSYWRGWNEAIEKAVTIIRQHCAEPVAKGVGNG